MSSAVQALLSSQGPMLSADLAKRLEATGVTAVNARKLIQRASGAVSRLSGVRFPRNEQFLYIGDDFGSSKFWKSLLKAFDARSSVYGWAANALIARSGAIPSYQFNIISGAPLRMKGQVSAESIRQRFEQIRFLSSTTLKDLGPCFLINPAVDDQLPDNPFSALRARLLAEEILLDALRDWVRKLGLGSYNRVEIRSSQLTPSFGQFCWDLVAPSYIPPFARFSGDGKLQPGFIVCDAVLGVELSKPQVGYFIRKVSTLRQNRKIRPFLAMLIAEHFSQEAFSALKQNGIVATQPSALFGQTVGRALRTLLSTLSNAAAAAAANPEVVSILFKDLSSIEGAAGNL